MIKITPRQREIASLVAHGVGNKEIAAILGISQQTVKNHLQKVFGSYEVQTRTQLAFAIYKESGRRTDYQL